MSRNRLTAALVAVAFALGPVGALAQFGSIFGAPPRPPAGVPNGSRQAPADQPYPPAYPPPQAPASPPPSSARVAPPGAVQSQPLPPPPGADQASQPTLSGLPPSGLPPSGLPPSGLPPSGLPPGQRAAPPRGAPQPVDTGPQPGDQVIAEPPSQKIVNSTALFSGLDKITGRIISFDVAIGETVQFGALQVTPRACYTRPQTETANTDAFVEVDEVTLQGEVKRIFTGWMFAASPGLHGVEHAIYDVWLTNCKGATQTVTATPTPDPTPPPSPPPARGQQNQQRAQQQPTAQQQQQPFQQPPQQQPQRRPTPPR
jgi:hypothetical protein